MAKFEICPKCNLNYIDLDKQEICDICKKTMLGERTVGDDFLLDFDIEDEELQSPFVQKTTNREEEYEEERLDEEDNDDNATWRGFVNMDDDLETPEFAIEEIESDDEDEEIEETEEYEEEDFEYVSADDYCPEEDEEDDDEDEDF